VRGALRPSNAKRLL